MAKRINHTQAAVETLAQEIEAGAFAQQGRLPTEAILCQRFALSRMTIRVVLGKLEQRGLIYRHQGKGTFINANRREGVGTIGLLLKDVAKASSPFLVEFLRGAESRASAQGLHVGFIGADPASASDGSRSAMTGVIVIPHQVTRAEIARLHRMQMPYIMALDSDLPGPTVRMEVATAAQTLAAGLLDLGHRRFGLISGHREHADRHKRIGIQAALRKAGLDLAEVPDLETDYRLEAGQAAAQSLLERDPRPTAIICFDDTLALQTISMAQQRGIDIPSELSVVGFNDAAFSSLTNPRISTVRFPISAAGEAAAAALINAAAAGTRVSSITLDHAVLWRGSTGPAPDTSRPHR